ncbi:MAG: glycogen debranching protein GlgX [Candidatus Thermoplasmatota archaeon]|nr:glycogen debranching protein GlgX [Candidatus Thermoplasmatota archaeon]
MQRYIPGKPYPLGSTLTDEGVNFAVFSEHGKRVFLNIYSSSEEIPSETIEMKESEGYVWHCFVPGGKAGLRYSFSVDGDYRPKSGDRFNVNKALIDPYAKALDGTVRWDNSIFGYRVGDPDGDLSFSNDRDDQFVPKSVVIDPRFDWDGIRKPDKPWNHTIIYETHVKGITVRNPDVPEEIRGTYSGLVSDHMIQYFKDLGITAVELMPIQQHVDDKFLVDMGLVNYWGYNTIAYFAPDVRYASKKDPGYQVTEFKRMVRKFHENDIEVILDVVYNHSAEGNQFGPTLSFRGLDNRTYYILDPEDQRRYVDFTGTGNSFDSSNPQVLQLITDSLRYWITEMQVDGFRFDLASTLARELYRVNMLSPFLATIHQDPIISRVKLIAEPWDVGPGGYQVGNFPVNWAEWNGRYRDSVRRFWNGETGFIGEFATRISGSPDIYKPTGRRPHASINFVTCHDGFTAMDLVSYLEKHNENNGLGNTDGSDINYSCNFGVEGPSQDPVITGRRYRRIKNLILTLMVSQGAPMLLGGDEIGRTQRGNNNAFCHDNEISWYDWNLDPEREELLKFVRRMITLRKTNHVLRKRDFFSGSMIPGTNLKDVTWMNPDGKEMTSSDWLVRDRRSLMVYLTGRYAVEYGSLRERSDSGDLILLFNASESPVMFRFPDTGMQWELYLDTNIRSVDELPIRLASRDYLLAPDCSAVIRQIV